MTTSSRRSGGSVISNAFQRSISPAGRFYSGSGPGAGRSGFASSSSSFSSGSTSFFQRSSSPTRVNLVGSATPNPSVRFSLPHHHRTTSPGRSIAVSDSAPSRRHISGAGAGAGGSRRRTCMCSPTNHPGSFRCSLHKGIQSPQHHPHSSYAPSHRLNARRSAMTNSLVRIGTVEGDLVKRALAALIRPSSHQQRRRVDFQPRPSRLSVMSKADDL